MTCFDFAGGIGTASRRIGEHTLGVLLMCNFGERERLTAGGLRFDPVEPSPPEGSCIAVCACDAPMTAQQLRRLALRPLLGLARAGSYAHNGSGEIAIAFTTAARADARELAAEPLLRSRVRGRGGGRLQLPGGRAAADAQARRP